MGRLNKMIVNAMKTVGWWIIEAIAFVLYGIRGTWRISRTPYRLVEKKYMAVKILTTIAKLVILVYLITIALTIVIAIIIGFVLVKSFFSSAEAGMRNNF